MTARKTKGRGLIPIRLDSELVTCPTCIKYFCQACYTDSRAIGINTMLEKGFHCLSCGSTIIDLFPVKHRTRKRAHSCVQRAINNAKKKAAEMDKIDIAAGIEPIGHLYQ